MLPHYIAQGGFLFFFCFDTLTIVAQLSNSNLVFMHPCTRFYYHVKMAMQNLAGRLQINLKLIWAFKSLCKLRWIVFGFYLKVWWSPELGYAVYIHSWLVLHGDACSWCVCVLNWLLFADLEFNALLMVFLSSSFIFAAEWCVLMLQE